MIGSLMNDELQRIWKKTVVMSSRQHSRSNLEWPWKNTISVSGLRAKIWILDLPNTNQDCELKTRRRRYLLSVVKWIKTFNILSRLFPTAREPNLHIQLEPRKLFFFCWEELSDLRPSPKLPCRLSATAYSTYSQLHSVSGGLSSFRKLRTRHHAVVTRETRYMVINKTLKEHLDLRTRK
jgi:hypothetical protein